MQNYTWKLLSHKWIFKWKIKADGIIDKYKARLIVKDFKIIRRYELF
jgi:hypothetical protein